jgi:hypothetical protein
VKRELHYSVKGSISKLFPSMFPGIAGKLKYMYEVTWENQKITKKTRE